MQTLYQNNVHRNFTKLFTPTKLITHLAIRYSYQCVYQFFNAN